MPEPREKIPESVVNNIDVPINRGYVLKDGTFNPGAEES